MSKIGLDYIDLFLLKSMDRVVIVVNGSKVSVLVTIKTTSMGFDTIEINLVFSEGYRRYLAL